MGTFSSNTTMKVNRAISGATTVNTNCYAIVTYHPNSFTNSSVNTSSPLALNPITQYFGPGQSIPSSITFNTALQMSAPSTVFTGTATYSIQSGVEFINTP